MKLKIIALTLLVAAPLTFAASDRASAGEWVKCTHEGGHCKNVKRGDWIRYAAGGPSAPHVDQTATGPFWCTNAVFGDPRQGRRKNCYVYKKTWVKCTHEGGHCKSAKSGDRVRYAAGSANSAHNETTVSGPFWCTNAVFGDPRLGRRKNCYVLK